MIRTDREYRDALRRLDEARAVAEVQSRSLQASGLPTAHLELVMSPLAAMQEQIEGEISWYERARGGDIRPVGRLSDVGASLIALRIARGLTQRQLAERLGVNEAQVSKDERNDYRGITVERAQRVLDALDGSVTVTLTAQQGRETEAASLHAR